MPDFGPALRKKFSEIPTLTGIQTLINKRLVPRVVELPDATEITPNADTADICTQTNTQAAGNLTVNAPTGTPTNGQTLELIITSTNVQTLIWNSSYVGNISLSIPTGTTGGGATDKLWFQYDSVSGDWQLSSGQYGY